MIFQNYGAQPKLKIQGVMVMNFTKILNADWTLSYDEQGREKPGLPKKYGSELLLAYYRYCFIIN